MRFLKFFIGALLVFFVIGCSDKKEDVTLNKPIYQEGDKVELVNVYGSAKYTLLRKGKGFVLEGDPSKIVMLDIYGTFCPPCQEEAAAFTTFQEDNKDTVVLIGLNYMEDVTNQYVIDYFVKQFGAYYFLANKNNGRNNDKLVDTIISDIEYNKAIQVPFKVILKDGIYQKLTDVYNSDPENKFYIGSVDHAVIQKDIDNMLKKR